MSYAYRDGKSIFIGYKDAQGRPVREKSTATTITEGRRIALELEQRNERIRRGLEAPPPPPTPFKDLAKRYLAEVTALKREKASEESRVKIHLVPELGEKFLTQIRAGDVEGLLARKARSESKPDGLSPKSLEHLRQTLHAMFNFAARAGLHAGDNPIDQVPHRDVPERAIRFLEPAIVARVVAAVPERWRNLFATAILIGARRGELFALKPGDVDLEHRTLTLESSHGGPTKSGKVRVVPIPDELVPFLRDALKHARGGLLFPGLDGKRLSKNTDLVDVLQRALVVAGIIDHWDLVCRRHGCGHVEQSPEKRSRACPKCGFALWPVEVPPAYLFKDLRSTWGTVACEVTGDLRFAQTGLGHSDPRITERYYAAVRARHQLD